MYSSYKGLAMDKANKQSINKHDGRGENPHRAKISAALNILSSSTLGMEIS